jgi:hypothetical protein
MNPASRNPQKREQIRVDHETGLIHGLPGGPQPLVGPTTGREYEQLKQNEARNEQVKRLLERRMVTTYQCTQCKRKWPGVHVRVKWRKQYGVNMETFVCPDSHCDAPVIPLARQV